MSVDSIKKVILDIFEKEMHRDLNKYDSWLDESIFGNKINLLPSEAVYLYIKIQNQFNIVFPERIVTEMKFNILKDIIEEIELCLGEI